MCIIYLLELIVSTFREVEVVKKGNVSQPETNHKVLMNTGDKTTCVISLGGGELKYLFSVHHLSSVSKHSSINDYTIIYNIANEHLVPLGVKIISCHAHLDRTQVPFRGNFQNFQF